MNSHPSTAACIAVAIAPPCKTLNTQSLDILYSEKDGMQYKKDRLASLTVAFGQRHTGTRITSK